MSGYPILLFLHVTGAILIFAGIATLIFGVAALRLSPTVEQVHAIARPMLLGRKIGDSQRCRSSKGVEAERDHQRDQLKHLLPLRAAR